MAETPTQAPVPPAELRDPRRVQALIDLIETVYRLRAPGGCAWDRAQTHQSLRQYLIEEAYEVLDVLDRIDSRESFSDEKVREAFREELGDLLFVCANPDLVIHRGPTALVYCAGALGRRYEDMGGPTIYAGKPSSPIYHAALAAAEAALGRTLDPAKTLAVGDSMRTAIAGAVAQGLDALFISAGIHRDEVHGQSGRSEAEGLEALFARENLWPYAAARSLAP